MEQLHRCALLIIKTLNKTKLYDGEASSWMQWAKSFRRFVMCNDDRWSLLLDEGEKVKGQPIVEDMETHWRSSLDFGPTPMKKWKS